MLLSKQLDFEQAASSYGGTLRLRGKLHIDSGDPHRPVADPFCPERFSEIHGAACVVAGEGGAMRSAGWNDPYNRERSKQKLFYEHLLAKNHVFRFFWEAILGRRWPRQHQILFIQFVFTLTVVSIFEIS